MLPDAPVRGKAIALNFPTQESQDKGRLKTGKRPGDFFFLSDLLHSGFDESVPMIASDSCTWPTGEEPNVAYPPQASMVCAC